MQVYPNGSVKIIDRSKNIFKLSQGEYIAPEKIENIINLSLFIAQSLIYGDSLKNSVVAVVIPEEQWATEWAAENNCEGQDFATLCQNPALKQAIATEVNRLCVENKCSSLEKPKDIHIASDLFSVENDTLTPTFKLKRHQANQLYKP